jgi:hypothetical protein
LRIYVLFGRSIYGTGKDNTKAAADTGIYKRKHFEEGLSTLCQRDL